MRLRRARKLSGVFSLHKTVFPEEAVALLNVREGACVVDATFGGGGHARLILEKIGERGTLIAIDQDPDALERMSALQQTFFNIIPINNNFRHIDTIVSENGFERVDAVLFDIGLSQYQLDASGRGFSFRKDEPLDMRMNPDAPCDAATILKQYSEEEIANLIYENGEERKSRRIARMIVEQRRRKPITTSSELAELVSAAYPPQARHGRIHPATRTFQALRIAVNDELGCLRDGIASAVNCLAPLGRCAVITFHSLEDRIVKHFFREEARKGTVDILTKKPLVVSDDERGRNPRARSAKLRVVEKRNIL